MTERARWRLFEAALILVCWPLTWVAMHEIEGVRPLISEWEGGAIFTGVMLRLDDAFRERRDA